MTAENAFTLFEKGIEDEKPFKERMDQRQSKYLIIAFCGPVGSKITEVVSKVEETLISNYGYEVHKIKISDLIKSNADRVPSFDKNKLNNAGERYLTLQDAGNYLRDKYDPDILGQLVIRNINDHRGKAIEVRKGEALGKDDLKLSHRVAYLIDSLKHPQEVDILRTVYGNMFYLFGILCAYPIRKKRLVSEEGISPDIVEKIMDRDKQEEKEYGQKLIKTLQYADFFIRNNHENVNSLNKQLGRYFDLIFGTKIVTPTKEEYAMYMAQSAALNSACLSRQIGAVITNKNGDIISTGCNDAPKAGGGLYCTEDGDNDMRCAFKSGTKCYNDYHKKDIKKKVEQTIKNVLEENKGKHELSETIASDIAEAIYKKTRLKDLIEFSRAVHAEMDAMISVARNETQTLVGSILYTTTFPCHNCSRHIIAAGIDTVYYIEPYEKSLALELHDDAILLEPPSSASCRDTKKVVYLHFEGVAPRQYMNLFEFTGERKSDGKMVVKNSKETIPALAEFVDSWVDFETKVVEHLTKLGFGSLEKS